jgi:MFS transporter, ACS family, hexuronate transporter
VLAPDLGRIIGWTEVQYSYIIAAFQGAYAIGLVCAGWVIDRLGTRLGYALAICIWSLAAAGHALATTPLQFGIARFFLGLGEAGNFPAAVKTVAEWFPKGERALATGIFNSGTSVGAVLAPAIVPIVAVTWGWQAAFLLTAALSATWILVWLKMYRAPPAAVEAGEGAGGGAPIGVVAGANTEATTPTVRPTRTPWRELLRHRQAWAFVAGKLITDPIWWFFIFWLPKFLNSQYGLTLTKLGPPLIAIYFIADIGSVAGGWIAARLMRRGWSVNRARKTTMLLCALGVVPIVLVSQVHDLWIAVGVLSLAVASHQGWSSNLFTLPSDLFPAHAVASVVGLGGFAGAVSGMLMATFTGFLLQATGSYIPLFVMAATAYLLALTVIHNLVPRLEPAQV